MAVRKSTGGGGTRIGKAASGVKNNYKARVAGKAPQMKNQGVSSAKADVRSRALSSNYKQASESKAGAKARKRNTGGRSR